MSNQNIPPYDYQVWFKGSRRPILMAGMHEDHIRWQSDPKVPIKDQEDTHQGGVLRSMIHLGPKGCTVNQPADYDKGFKILKAWLDTQEGPPESVRQELRELFIDYDRAKSKTTRSSTKKKLRHKI